MSVGQEKLASPLGLPPLFTVTFALTPLLTAGVGTTRMTRKRMAKKRTKKKRAKKYLRQESSLLQKRLVHPGLSAPPSPPLPSPPYHYLMLAVSLDHPCLLAGAKQTGEYFRLWSEHSTPNETI